MFWVELSAWTRPFQILFTQSSNPKKVTVSSHNTRQRRTCGFVWPSKRRSRRRPRPRLDSKANSSEAEASTDYNRQTWSIPWSVHLPRSTCTPDWVAPQSTKLCWPSRTQGRETSTLLLRKLSAANEQNQNRILVPFNKEWEGVNLSTTKSFIIEKFTPANIQAIIWLSRLLQY